MTLKRWSVVVVAVLLGGSDARAQQVAPVASVSIGSRVRVLAPTIRRDRFTGRVDSLEAGEMVLDTAGVRRRLGFEMGPVLVEQYRRVRLRTAAVERIEVSAGRTTRSATLKGAIIGGLIGAALIGFGQAPEVNPSFQDFLDGAPKGFIGGVIVGGAVGYALGGEKWVPAELPR